MCAPCQGNYPPSEGGAQQGIAPTTKAFCCEVALQLCMGKTASRTAGKKLSD